MREEFLKTVKRCVIKFVESIIVYIKPIYFRNRRKNSVAIEFNSHSSEVQ